MQKTTKRQPANHKPETPADRASSGAGNGQIIRPLGYVERVMKFAGDLGAFQVCRAVLLRGPLTPEVLRIALDGTRRRYPLLQSRCQWDRGDLVFRLPRENTEVPLRIVTRENDSSWMREVVTELRMRFEPAGCPWRIAFLPPAGRDRKCELIISCHHTISDAISSTAMVDQIMSYCREFVASGRLPEVVPQPVLAPVELLLPGPSNLQRKIQYGIMALQRFFRLRTANLFVSAYRKNRDVGDRETRVLYHDLGQRDSCTLFDRCRAEQTTVYGALCAALLMAARNHVKYPNRRMSCSSSVSLRQRCDPAVPMDQFGLFFYWVDTFHRLEDGTRFWDLARSCSQKVRTAARRSACPVRVVFGHARIAKRLIQGPMRHAMNNPRNGRTDTIGISSIGRLAVADRYGPFHVSGIYSATAQHVMGSCAAILAGTLGHRLLISFPYVWPMLDDEAARSFLECYTEQLRAACQ